MKYFDRKAFLVALVTALLLVAAIYAGSRRLRHFDPALTTYAFGCVFAAFAVAYRYAVWAQRPPTRMYLKRGWQSFWESGPLSPRLPVSPSPRLSGSPPRPVAIAINFVSVGRMLLDNFVLQTFISRRSYERWIMHACLSWGCMMAFAFTFPLVFGWLHFETLSGDAEVYKVFLFGFAMDQFNVHSLKAVVLFNLLNLSAVMMLVGVALSVKRRIHDAGEVATQTFGDDIFPVFLLFTVAATGLMLSVSSNFMAGHGYPFIAIAHAASVIALLIYLPFGKFFHIFQRPASLGVAFYKKSGTAERQAACHRCGESFASQMHIDDLKTVLDQLGFDYRFPPSLGGRGLGGGDELHYQDICPPCRRRVLAVCQGKTLGR